MSTDIRILRAAILSVVTISLVGFIVTIALITSPQLRVQALSAHAWISSTEAPYCTLQEAWRAGERSHLQGAITERIKGESRIVRTEQDLTLVDTGRGTWWVPNGNLDALHYNLAEQAREIYRRVRPGDTVLDCGANIGAYSRQALIDGAKLVVAIEPAPANLECLRRNLASEINAGRVVVYPKGVWSRNDVLPLHINESNEAADSFVRKPANDTRVIAVPLTTIDQIASELKLSRVDLIKMDIEGAEREALAGAKRTIRQFTPRLVICVYHLPDDPEVITRAILTLLPAYRVTCDCVYGSGGAFPEVAFADVVR